MSRGILYGISVGSGEGGQMTLKALRCVQESDILLLPAASRESCHAYRIAVSACPEVEHKEYRCYDFPMTRSCISFRGVLIWSRHWDFRERRCS